MTKRFLKYLSFLSVLAIIFASCVLPLSAAGLDRGAEENDRAAPAGYAFGKIFYGGDGVGFIATSHTRRGLGRYSNEK